MPEAQATLTRSVQRTAVVTAIQGAFALMGKSPELAGRTMVAALDKLAKTNQQKMVAEWMREWMKPGNPGVPYLKRIATELHPNIRKRWMANFIANFFFRDPTPLRQLAAEKGISTPTLIAISPLMRCNLRCVGCYAGNYPRKDDMPPELFDRIITEAEELGTRVFFLIGGEPFFYEPLLDILEQHPDSVFQPYTNATLIDENVADRLQKMGNVVPAVSLEGFSTETNNRRGNDVFERAMAAMDIMKDRGLMMAFSATATPHNIDIITSDEWVDMMIEKGAFYGWYFTYVPVGLNPDLNYMPTPEQRDRLRRGVSRVRNTKPILVADFWNDGPLTGGCIAGGRRYIHINNKADVEPCVFVHFAVDNLKEKSLVEALGSDFFKGFRSMQPFGRNLLRPCPIIDHPAVIKSLVTKYGARPTHEGADDLFKPDLHHGLITYAKGVADLYKPVWDQEYQWVDRWVLEDEEYKRRMAKKIDADDEVAQN